MTFIPLHHFKEHIPNEIGVEVRINHTECPAGEDTRGRLFIRRRRDGNVVAYCHNCSGKAFISMARPGVRNLHDSLALLEEPEHHPSVSKNAHGIDAIAMPTDASSNMLEDWSGEAVAWVTKYDILPEDVEQHGICYSPSLNKVLIPVHVLFRGQRSEVGYQARRLDDNPSVPKYVTYVPRVYQGRVCFIPTTYGARTDTLVIVEDALSAIKVGRQFNSVAVLTATVAGPVLQHARDYERVIVSLDNDNPTVLFNAGKTVKQLQAWGVNVNMATIKKDPKELSDEQILDIYS